MRLPKWLISALAPVAAFGFALGLSAIVLQISGNPPGFAFTSMWDFARTDNSIVSIINRATPLYLSALAAAVGFQMNLFNIGIEGSYRIAALLAAAFGAAVSLPGPLHVLSIIIVAMLVGAAWSGVAGVLKVKRGVHEVITSIMMNAIATGVGAWLLRNHLREKNVGGDLVIKTKTIPESGWFPALDRTVRNLPGPLDVQPAPGSPLYGFVLVAALVGVGYWLLVWRTRFGFDLRASGINPFAARVSGVQPDAMIIRTMLLSGAVAGLVGLPALLGFFHRYTIDFPTGLGFTGLGIALLGRNHPVGVAVGAVLWAFLDRSAQILDLNDIPKEIVVIMQGITVLSVVVAYEVTRRIIENSEVKAAARAIETPGGAVPPAPGTPTPAAAS